MNNVSFAYFRAIKSNKKVGNICACIQKLTEDESIVSFSYCSPHDIFNKPKARALAKDRLNQGVNIAGKTNIQKTALNGLLNQANIGCVPSWVSTALKSGNLYLGLTQQGELNVAIVNKSNNGFYLSGVDRVTRY